MTKLNPERKEMLAKITKAIKNGDYFIFNSRTNGNYLIIAQGLDSDLERLAVKLLVTIETAKKT
jgi:hypothetical protein